MTRVFLSAFHSTGFSDWHVPLSVHCHLTTTPFRFMKSDFALSWKIIESPHDNLCTRAAPLIVRQYGLWIYLLISSRLPDLVCKLMQTVWLLDFSESHKRISLLHLAVWHVHTLFLRWLYVNTTITFYTCIEMSRLITRKKRRGKKGLCVKECILEVAHWA